MRDFLQALRTRVVIYDGGMGATLEQLDLTSADYGGLAGRCHEALVLNRPDVIQGVHSSMLDAGAEVVENVHVPGFPNQARRVGLGSETLEINTTRRADRARGRGLRAFCCRLDRADWLPSSLRRPDTRADQLP